MGTAAPVQYQNSDTHSNQDSNRQLRMDDVSRPESIDNRSSFVQLKTQQSLTQGSSRTRQLRALGYAAQNGHHLTNLSKFAGGEIQLKKDKAVASFNDGESGKTTATKVIDPKDGSRGLFKYAYGSGNIIDSFNGKNIADPKIASKTEYASLGAPNIAVKVASHNLATDYSGGGALTSTQIATGGRPLHFSHADKAHSIDRTNKYTWHHLQALGKMELIDMNVHGAMWHYGGISGWAGSTHASDDGDDDPSA